jgi:hypothetical protein
VWVPTSGATVAGLVRHGAEPIGRSGHVGQAMYM